MLSIDIIRVYVHDFKTALRFWSVGLGLKVVDSEEESAAPFAILEPPAGVPAIHLIGGADPYPLEQRPIPGTRPEVFFDVVTTEFDDTLVRLIENGGRRLGDIETHDETRVVSVADPDGNMFDLFEIPEEQ